MQEPDDISKRTPRRTTRRLLILASFTLLLGAALAVLWLMREPTQDGQPISHWIAKMATGSAEAGAALDKFGPEKSIPYLLKAIDGRIPQWTASERIYARLHSTFPASLRQRLPAPQRVQSPRTAEFIQSRAAYYVVQLADKHPSLARKAVPQLVPMLGSTNGSTRFSAGIALSGFGSNAVPAIPMIEKLLRNDPGKIHDVMLHVLEKCGSETKAIFPALKNGLTSSNGLLSIGCARTLWRLDSAQADLVRPVAMRWTAGQDAGLRIESASLLWRIDKDPAPVVPVLIGLLNEDGHPFDYRTMLLLKQIGPVASNAIPALTERMKRSKRKEDFYLKAAEAALQAMSGINLKPLPPEPR